MIRKHRKVRKPSWRWEIIDGTYQKFSDGRLVILENTKGRAQYRAWTLDMAQRQHWVCGLKASGNCLWPTLLMIDGEGPLGVTFEHFDKRGAGKRNDSPDPATHNCAAHSVCNGRLGSRRIVSEPN